MNIIKNSNNGDTLKISNGSHEEEYYYFWLRDHCKCKDCYNHATSQRKVDVTNIPIDIKAMDCQIDGDTLKVDWEDGHKSEYSLSYLQKLSYQNYYEKLKRNYILWTRNDIINFSVSHVDYKNILETEEGVYDVMKSLINYGVGFIENVPPNVTDTEKVMLKLSHIQTTLFGSMWEFSDQMDHNDTAYTAEGLGAHTDNTYFTEPAGLQALHCLSHTGTGGETLLVDGFKAVEILKKSNREAYKRLTTICVEAEYLEPGYHHTYSSPLIILNAITGQPQQIRFNINDRAPVSLPKDQILQHYHDLRLLSSIIKDSSLEWKFKLRPGTVLVFDNFRVLHGRTSYTGHRTMCGCYIGRGDFLSKARVLNLI